MNTSSSLVLLAACYAFQLSATSLPSLKSPRVSAAITADDNGRVFVIGGTADGAERFDPVQVRWEPMAAPKVSRVGAGAGWIDDKLVLVGGTETDLVEVYEPAVDRWAEAPLKVPPRRNVAVVSGDAAVFIIGGARANSWGLPLVDRITWNRRDSLQSMDYGRSEHAAVAVAGEIYLVGGVNAADPNSFIAQIEAYTIATNRWRTVAKLPTPRAGVGAAVDARGRIHIIGGRGVDGRVHGNVEIFDPKTKNWTFGASMPTPRSNFALAETTDRRFLVVGGRDAKGRARAMVEGYLPEENTWLTSEEPSDPGAL